MASTRKGGQCMNPNTITESDLDMRTFVGEHLEDTLDTLKRFGDKLTPEERAALEDTLKTLPMYLEDGYAGIRSDLDFIMALGFLRGSLERLREDLGSRRGAVPA